jgi:hypothetical protein
VIRDLRGLRATLFPERTPPGFDPAGDRLWIPAFRLLGSEPGDEAFKLLCEWLHARPLPVADGKLPVGVGGRAWGAALGAADAARLGRFVLLALHSTAAAAALGTLVFKSRLAQPRCRIHG